MADDVFTDEDLAALDELEERALERCMAEVERRSAAMVAAQEHSPLRRS